MKIRVVPGTGGFYAVSKTGNVYSCKISGPIVGRKGEWRKMRPGETTKYGHQFIVVYLGSGKKKNRLVHHMVLETFRGPRPKGLECRHLDGNPRNNNLTNLKWGTRKKNAEDSVRHGTSSRGVDRPSSVLNEKKIRNIRRRLINGENQRSIAKRYGVSQPVISGIKNGKTWYWVK